MLSLPIAGLQVQVRVIWLDDDEDGFDMVSWSPPTPVSVCSAAPVLLLRLPVLVEVALCARMPSAFSTAGIALAAAKLSAMRRNEIEMGCMVEKGCDKEEWVFCLSPAGREEVNVKLGYCAV